MKRIMFIVGICVMTILLSSCSMITESVQSAHDAVLIREELMREYGSIHNLIDGHKDENGEYLLYKDQTYRLEPNNLFTVHPNNEAHQDDVMISWSDALYLYQYYADDKQDPTFIYATCDSRVFIREDYDYTSDIFIVEGTGNKFLFSDALIPASVALNVTNNSYTEIAIYSKQYPRLYAHLRIVCQDGNWYVVGYSGDITFVLSREFAELLSQKELLN